jgi:transposase
LNFARLDGHPTLVIRPGRECPEWDVHRSTAQEFRADAVALVLTTEIGIAQGARDLGVNPKTLRNWVKQAKIDRGLGPVGALTTAERQEFTRLRRRVAQLEQERSILVKAAVFFAKETTR